MKLFVITLLWCVGLLAQPMGCGNAGFVAPFNMDPLHFSRATLFCSVNNKLNAYPRRILQLGGLGVSFAGGSTADYNSYGSCGKFGTNIVVDTTFTIVNEYTSVPMDPNFPGNGSIHAGPIARLYNPISGDFAGFVGISAQTGTFQIVDRVAGTEYVTLISVTGGLSTNVAYRIRVENRSGDDATAYLMQPNGSVITNYSWTFHAGVPTGGVPSFHTYGCDAYVTNFLSFSGDLTWQAETYRPWVPVNYNVGISGVYVTNGVITMYSDATEYGITNDYSILISPVSGKNGVYSGVLGLQSGRAIGIAFRSASDGTGYYIIDDENVSKFKLWKGRFSDATPTLVNEWVNTMAVGTDYPFTLTLNGNDITFVCNGVTCAQTDTSYPNAGYVGILGFNSAARFSKLHWSPSP